MLDTYFGIWPNNSRITEETVRALYASTVIYYGRRMSQAEVYRDKLNFVRHWPARAYSIAPGTGRRDGSRDGRPCTLSAILRWQARDASGSATRQGASRI